MRQRSERRGRPGRHACARRLDAVAAAERRGDTDRSAAVGSEMDIAHAENDGGHGAAGGPARRFARVPRIARHSRQWAVGDGFPAELGHCGLADEDRALLAQARNRRRIMLRRLARRELGSEPGGHAGDEQIVFDADRDAVDETSGRARHPTRLGLPRAPARALAIEPAVGIHHAVVPIDLMEHGIDHLDRREIFASITREQLGDRQEGGGILWCFGYDARSCVRIGSYRMNRTMYHGSAAIRTSQRVRMMSRRGLCSAIAGVALVAAAAAAEGEAWPTRAIQVISPFTAGNANDTVARVVLDQVSRQLGQPFVIENKPGGGGTIGPGMVAKAEADGYTILLHSSSMSAQVVLHRTLPYDPIRDFAPVVIFGIQPNVLVAAPSTGFKTVADLVAAAKARPGALTYASAGIGSASHMAAERLRLAAGIDVQHIPFRGAEGMAEVMAGRIDFYFVPIAPAVPVIADGKVAVLAVSTPTRAPALPNVPTIAEAGYPDARYVFWGGFSAPPKTPRP